VLPLRALIKKNPENATRASDKRRIINPLFGRQLDRRTPREQSIQGSTFSALVSPSPDPWFTGLKYPRKTMELARSRPRDG
jgi:hypothetical protein